MRGLRGEGRKKEEVSVLAGEENPSCPLPPAGPQE